MQKTTLYLTDELRHALETAARRSGRTQAEIVRQALHGHLEGPAAHYPPRSAPVKTPSSPLARAKSG